MSEQKRKPEYRGQTLSLFCPYLQAKIHGYRMAELSKFYTKGLVSLT